MTLPARVFMDVSYTRTQHVSTGIVRTVRRLEEELGRLVPAGGGSFAAVAYHSSGFRELAGGRLAQMGRPATAAADPRGARLFRWITGPLFRRMVLAAVQLPWPVLRRLWSAGSSLAFDFLSRAGRAVEFRPGDMLLLCDASWNYPAWVAVRKAHQQGAQVVLVVYDLMPFDHPEFCFPLVPPTFGLWLREMLVVADCAICISRATEDGLRAHAARLGIALPPTGHFRLGSDPARTPTGGDVRPTLRQFLQAGLPCFAAIGSFEPKKNYGFLLEVFEGLWQRGLPLRLLIIGRESAECRELARRVREHPRQGDGLLALFDATDAEVAFAYSACRALVFTSLAEGFGLPLVEARTRGSLVIASNLPAFVELADAGVSLYPQGSKPALEDLLIEHAGHDRRPEVAPMDAFTWEDSARQCLRVSRELARGVRAG